MVDFAVTAYIRELEKLVNKGFAEVKRASDAQVTAILDLKSQVERMRGVIRDMQEELDLDVDVEIGLGTGEETPELPDRKAKVVSLHAEGPDRPGA